MRSETPSSNSTNATDTRTAARNDPPPQDPAADSRTRITCARASIGTTCGICQITSDPRTKLVHFVGFSHNTRIRRKKDTLSPVDLAEGAGCNCECCAPFTGCKHTRLAAGRSPAPATYYIVCALHSCLCWGGSSVIPSCHAPA